MSEAERDEGSAEEARPSLDEFLDGIAQLQRRLDDERERILDRIETDKARLDEIEAELERIAAVLVQGGKLKRVVVATDRAPRVEARVLPLMEELFHQGCTEIHDDHLVKTVRDRYPDLSQESILSAVRRLANNHKIARGGRRRSRFSCPVLGKASEPLSESMDDRVLDVLFQNKPKEMTLQELSWACGGDTLAVDAAVKELAGKRRITMIIYPGANGTADERKYQHKEPEPSVPIGTPLFGGMEPPR